jgi:hypothetical protein
MSQPYFGWSERMKLPLPKLGIWSPLGLLNVWSSTTRPKTPRIEVFLVSLEMSWSVKWNVLGGHLSPKLWAKEGPGVKLAVWLPTTKSQESTSSRPPNGECDITLKRSRRELQLWFRPRRNQSLQSGVMSVQSPGTPTGIVSGQFRNSNLGVPGKRAIWV